MYVEKCGEPGVWFDKQLRLKIPTQEMCTTKRVKCLLKLTPMFEIFLQPLKLGSGVVPRD